DECCCECGNALNGIFCQQCICKSCGKGAHIGYNCPPKVLIISNPESCNQTINNELPQTLPSFDSVPCVSKPNFVDESSKIFNPPPQHPIYSGEFCGSDTQYGHYCTPQAQFNNPEPGYSQDFNFPTKAKARYWKIPVCCDNDDDYDSAITPILSTEETSNSLSMGDEHLDTIPATKSDKVIKSSAEDLVLILSEFEGIPDTMCDVHLDNNHTPLEAKDHVEIVINSNDDISSSDDDSLHEENIEYVEASPHDSELVSLEAAEISSSISLNSFLEETNTFHNSLPEFENFYFDLGEISSGSTTTHSDISLPDYEAFSFDDGHIKEISSGSPTTQTDISRSEYDSFTFDFANEEFVDKLAHIISPPEYDCFYFRDLPDPGELMYVLNSGIRENLFTTLVNLPTEDDYSPILAYVYSRKLEDSCQRILSSKS
nr:hypothetical protein [Tanacetum cinerariifolium]